MIAISSRIVLRDDIEVGEPLRLVEWYFKKVRRGPDYYRRSDVVVGDPDVVEFGDLAWAVLLEGQPKSLAAQSLLNAPISLKDVSSKPLAELDKDDRATVVNKIVELIELNGFGWSLATKVLHAKRRQTVPVMDNQAIFGSLMKPHWRIGGKVSHGSEKRESAIDAALNEIYERMVDRQSDWDGLAEAAVNLAGVRLADIEVFDICWWAVLRADAETLETAGVVQT